MTPLRAVATQGRFGRSRRIRLLLAASMLLLGAIGCSDDDDDPSGPVLQLKPGVDSSWAGDPLAVDSAKVFGDSLVLIVRYGGGCVEHGFELFGQTAFMESQPPQLSVVLAHEMRADPCDAIVSRRLAFDITPARLLHEEQFGSDDPFFLRLQWAPWGQMPAGRLVACPMPDNLHQSDLEAASMAALLSGELVGPDPLYDQVHAELQYIRSRFATELAGLEAVHFRYPWALGEFLLGMSPAAWGDGRGFPAPGWRDMADLLGLSVENPRGNSTVLFADGVTDRPFNSCRLVDLYGKPPGIMHFLPNYYGGDWSCIYPARHPDGAIDYFFRRGFGDCLAGCLHEDVAFVERVDDGFVFRGRHDTTQDAPTPAWWTDFNAARTVYQGWASCPFGNDESTGLTTRARGAVGPR